MASKKDKFKEFEKLPFEDALKRLETIVQGMEDGKAPLEELIVKFEEGGALAAICQKRLDELQGKIEILTKDSSQGPQWKDFDPEGEKDELSEEEEEESEREAKPSKKPASPEDLLF